MKRISLCLVLGLILLMVGTAIAAPPQLKGRYAFTGESSMLIIPQKSDDPTSQSNPSDPSQINLNQPMTGYKTFSGSYSVQGIRTFNGDGTGTVSGTTVEIFPQAHSPRYNSSTGTANWTIAPQTTSQTFSYQFTYTVDKTGNITTQMVPGSYLGTFDVGPRTGQTLSIDVFSMTGYASNNNMTLTLSTPEPEIETHTYYKTDGTPPDVHYMICHRSRVLIWLGN